MYFFVFSLIRFNVGNPCRPAVHAIAALARCKYSSLLLRSIFAGITAWFSVQSDGTVVSMSLQRTTSSHFFSICMLFFFFFFATAPIRRTLWALWTKWFVPRRVVVAKSSSNRAHYLLIFLLKNKKKQFILALPREKSLENDEKISWNEESSFFFFFSEKQKKEQRKKLTRPIFATETKHNARLADWRRRRGYSKTLKVFSPEDLTQLRESMSRWNYHVSFIGEKKKKKSEGNFHKKTKPNAEKGKLEKGQ